MYLLANLQTFKILIKYIPMHKEYKLNTYIKYTSQRYIKCCYFYDTDTTIS